MLPLLAWLVLAILLCNVVFVAVRLWAARQPRAAERPRSFRPAYAAIVAKEYPRRPGRAQRRDRSGH